MKKAILTIIMVALACAACIFGRMVLSMRGGVWKQSTAPTYKTADVETTGIVDTLANAAGGVGLKRVTVWRNGDYITQYKYADGRYEATWTMFGMLDIPVGWLYSWD